MRIARHPPVLPRILSLDALLLLALVLARGRIDTFANVIVPRPAEEVLRLPGARLLLSDQAVKLMADFLTDPLSLLVLTASMALVAVYLVLDVLARSRQQTGGEDPPQWVLLTKVTLIGLIIFVSVGLNTLMVIGLRVATEPHRYAHDGGVLMTEQAARWVAEGKNPYSQTFRGTDMEKAFPSGPGFVHYPYLPLAFLPTVPVMALFKQIAGWYDQRLVYLALYALALVSAGFLVRPAVPKLLALQLIGLNPILANDLIYGLNDVVLIGWIALATLCVARRRHYLGALFLGMAVAIKLTAWPLVPFVLLAMLPEKPLPPAALARYYGPRLLLLLLPLLATTLPFAIADPANLYDDVWAYNTGSSPLEPVPLKGWGISSLVQLWGWVPNNEAPFPFFIPQALVGIPLLAALFWAQWRRNTIGAALIAGSAFLFVFFLFSRTMNPNYLGFTLSTLTLGYFADADGSSSSTTSIPASMPKCG